MGSRITSKYLATPFSPLTDGVLHGEELDRFEVRAPGAIDASLRVGAAFEPLPIGAQFDPATGTLTWTPGVGFVGTYDFRMGHRDVRIALHPRGSLEPRSVPAQWVRAHGA